MKKYVSVIFFSILLCFVITAFFPHPGKSELNVDHSISAQASSHTNSCLSCHMVGDLHKKDGHDDGDCSKCHDGTPRTGNVEAEMCSNCHPTDDPGKCGLVTLHPASCLRCHNECAEDTTTTTIAVYTSHSDICLSCHFEGDLHDDATDEYGYLNASTCTACHPTGNPGKCGLVNGHPASCLECHSECVEGPTTTVGPGATTTVPKFEDHMEICSECHYPDDLHEKEKHDDGNCSKCHDGTPQSDNVESDKCSGCHPAGDPGKCNLVNVHGVTCLECHDFECKKETITTTVALTTTTTEPGSSTHIEICSECHYPDDLHEKDGHTTCDQCHDGTPGKGNVEPSPCIACHPVTGPGKCNLVNVHGITCLKCHFNCEGGTNTITSTTTSTVPPGPGTKPCPSTLALRGNIRGLETLRAFRDEVLDTSASGRAYINLYYRYAREITLMMMSDKALRLEAADALADLLPEIDAIMKDGKGTISAESIAEVESLLDKFSANASPELKSVIKMVKADVKRGKIVGITIVKQP